MTGDILGSGVDLGADQHPRVHRQPPTTKMYLASKVRRAEYYYLSELPESCSTGWFILKDPFAGHPISKFTWRSLSY